MPSSTTTAAALGLSVTHVPRYSPHAVAEHAVGLVLALNRKIHLQRAHARVRAVNFALTGLLGVDLHGRTVGVIGTGAIGEVFARRARTSSAFDTVAVIDGLKSGRIGHLGIDVYDVLSRLLTFPNVTVTGHQASSPRRRWPRSPRRRCAT